MQRLVVHALVIVVALLVAARIVIPSAPDTGGAGPSRALMLESDAGGQGGFAGDDTIIERDGSGQFRLPARVNGEDTEFLVDTGADIVALTVADAERMGLDVSPERFAPIMQTASGVGRGARVQLDVLELGDDEFHNVGAVVVEGLEVNLLGQSVLRRFGKVELRGDRMVIEHR